MQSLTERPLRLVPALDTAPATPCPCWCVARHESGDRFHYADTVATGPVELRLEIRSDDIPIVEIRTASADGNELTLRELDDVIAALQAKRRELAALTRTDWGDAS